MRPVIFCFTLSPPPSSATVMSATSAKEREARASSLHQRRVAPALGGDEAKTPKVKLWNSAPAALERVNATCWSKVRLEQLDPALLVLVLQRLDLGEEIRVAAERALGEGDQRARQDVGAFDGDADRHHLIGGLDIIGGSVADAAAAMDVERVVHALRMRSVETYLSSAEMTAGFSPAETIEAVTARAASSS